MVRDLSCEPAMSQIGAVGRAADKTSGASHFAATVSQIAV